MRFLFVLVLLVGCATPEQKAEQALADFGPYCARLGYQAGTEKYSDCVSQAYNAERQRKASLGAGILSRH